MVMYTGRYSGNSIDLLEEITISKNLKFWEIINVHDGYSVEIFLDGGTSGKYGLEKI